MGEIGEAINVVAALGDATSKRLERLEDEMYGREGLTATVARIETQVGYMGTTVTEIREKVEQIETQQHKPAKLAGEESSKKWGRTITKTLAGLGIGGWTIWEIFKGH